MISEFELTHAQASHARRGFMTSPASPAAVMVIIHGFGEHCGRYHGMAEYLAAKNIAVVSADLEGHGKLTPKQGVCRDYEIMHGDVTALIEKAKAEFPNLPVFVYGHSMGGGLVLNHGLSKAPDVAGYLVSAPLIKPTKPIADPLRVLVRILNKIAPNLTIGNEIVGARVTSIPEEQKKYESDPLNHGKLGVGLAISLVEGGEWIEANAEKWTAPLLLMHARQDQLTLFEATEKFAAVAANCEFMPMDDCEHEMHNDVSQAAVYAAMTDFISERI